MLHSVLSHAGDLDVHVHYLHGPKFPERSAALLAEMVEREGGSISFLSIADADVAGLPIMEHLAPTAWYRIFLPELLPDVDRLLYLDVDVIALDSLVPLWATDLTGNYVGAVTNVLAPWDLHWPGTLGLEGPSSYFNSGVLLMNLDEMRRNGCSEALRAWTLANRERMWFADQDPLNVVLGERRVPLHPRWNCMNAMFVFPSGRDIFGVETLEEARRRPAIRHFEGPSINKPWHYLCDHDMRELYFRHRRQTPWPDCRLEGVTPRNVMKRWTRRARSALSA